MKYFNKILRIFIDLKNEKKRQIQEKVRKVLNVRVDQVVTGYGTSNTGNVARKCLKNYEEFADAIEVDKELVKRLAIIIAAFRTTSAVDYNLLERFCWETYKYNYEVYPWSMLNPTVHKLLKHGCEIATNFPLSMSYYAEDAVESWHKIYR